LNNLNPATASIANITGTAALAGGVLAVFAPGTYAKTSYDVLHAAGGLGGTKFSSLSLSNPNFTANLSYTATDVFLNLTGVTLGGGTPLNGGQQGVAGAINNALNGGGTLPPGLAGLLGLTGNSLASALSQLNGEVSTGAERAAFQLTDQFLELMLDPFVNGRGYAPGLAGGGALGFAPDQQTSLPDDVALAYASILKAPPKPTFDQRWSTWGTGFGGVQFQDFNTPAFGEVDTTGGGLGLNFAAQNSTDVRTELGSRFDAPTLVYGKPLVLYGRVAWAHDFVSNPALGAAFQALPGGAFTVNGAPIPHDSALTTVGARLFLTANWSVIGKFDGEFAKGSQTYAGSGTLRYTW
jgi:hypothetical protein